MKHQLWSSLTVAAILVPVLSLNSSSHAESNSASNSNLGMNHQKILSDFHTPANPSLSITPDEQGSPIPTPQTEPIQVVKVGEYQSQSDASLNPESVAKIKAHELNQQQAATLYVRNIPVLTFVKNAPNDTKTGTTPTSQTIKVGTRADQFSPSTPVTPTTASTQTDPVSRATQVAAQINQLIQNNFDADSIRVRWDAERERYLIEVAGEELVTIDSQTILPDTTNDTAVDALQATNRLRRQMGNAAPLKKIENDPKEIAQNFSPTVAAGFLFQRITGWASWYGPGFDGNQTASGEIFDQYELTAAHPSLPFGTVVRVTNQDNGQSVVVRINDRGPYAGGRVIDLSKAAAQALGMMSSGVAPVQIDVLTAMP